MRYDHDLGGRVIRTTSMEAGERRTLPDIAGQPCHSWDSRGHRVSTAYDALRRPVEVLLRVDDDPELVVARTVYGETLADAEERNLRAAVHQAFDGAGVVTTERLDFKGNLLASSRRFTVGYRDTPDWSEPPELQPETFTTAARYDALNRPVQLVAPHSGDLADVIQPRYDEAGLLERIDVWSRRPLPTGLLDQASADLHAVSAIDHDAKGQRRRIVYGNGAVTTYEHDPQHVPAAPAPHSPRQ